MDIIQPNHIEPNDIAISLKDKKVEDNLSITKEAISAEAERIELEGRRNFFLLRKNWSTCIISWISVFIAFHIILTFCVGFKWLDFTNNPWIVPSIVLENFAQIIGMGIIVMKFLYPKNS